MGLENRGARKLRILISRTRRPKYKAPFETGPEYQLIDDDNYPWVSETGKEGLEDWQKTGCNYAMYVPETKQVNLRENGTPLWYFTRMDMLSTG